MLESFADMPERWLDLSWEMENDTPNLHVGRINLSVLNVPGSLGDLSTIIAKNGGNISNLKILRFHDISQRCDARQIFAARAQIFARRARK